MISLVNLKKSWLGFELELDVACSADGITVLLGESGAGKSSVLRLIAGFEYPDSGSILLSDKDISLQTPESRSIGVVFQDYALFPHLSVEKNIAFGLHGQAAAAKKQRVAELLELTGLQGFGSRSVNELSGGEQQRVALARALAPRPAVLLLDEPFSAIDPERREELGQYLVDLQAKLRIPMIFVTHSRNEALQIASKLLLLRRGSLVEDGTPRDLYTHPRFEYTARFLGPLSVFDGRTWAELGLSSSIPAEERAMLRPEEFLLSVKPEGRFQVRAVQFRGGDSLYFLDSVEWGGNRAQRASLLARSNLDLHIGQRCNVELASQPRILEPPPPLW